MARDSFQFLHAAPLAEALALETTYRMLQNASITMWIVLCEKV